MRLMDCRVASRLCGVPLSRAQQPRELFVLAAEFVDRGLHVLLVELRPGSFDPSE